MSFPMRQRPLAPLEKQTEVEFYRYVLEKEKLQVDSFGVMKGRSIYNVWIY